MAIPDRLNKPLNAVRSDPDNCKGLIHSPGII